MNLDKSHFLTHKKQVNISANIAIPSLSYDPATDREIYPGTTK